MFKALGQSFVDIFRKPLNLVYCYLIFVIIATISSLIYEYTYVYFDLPNISLISTLLYIIQNHFWIFVIYLALFLGIILTLSLFITYVINKKQDQKQRFLGASKLFGFSLFLAIITLIPNVLFLVLEFNLVWVILLILIYLLYLFIILPYLFLMPVLLVSNDLKLSLSESFKFVKLNYGWILALQIILIILLNVIVQILDYISIYVGEIGSVILYLLFFSILFLWGLNFSYNWYNSNKS